MIRRISSKQRRKAVSKAMKKENPLKILTLDVLLEGN